LVSGFLATGLGAGLAAALVSGFLATGLGAGLAGALGAGLAAALGAGDFLTAIVFNKYVKLF
jgi:hypothetical protein